MEFSESISKLDDLAEILKPKPVHIFFISINLSRDISRMLLSPVAIDLIHQHIQRVLRQDRSIKVV